MLRLSRIFTDGMILQRGDTVRVWGWANGDVCLSLTGKEELRAHIEREGEKFTAVLPPVTDTSVVWEISVRCGREELHVKNVRFGDVFLALGQSNMAYGLSATEGWEEIAARAAKADVAFLSLGEKEFSDISELTRPVRPLADLAQEYRWISGSEKELQSVSALSVMTAVLHSERTGVPTGVVIASMGGLSVETYVPREYVEQDEKWKAFCESVGRYVSEKDYNHKGGVNFTQLAGVYNEKVAPLAGLRFAALLWLLGESSAWDYAFAEWFAHALRTIVRVYRATFDGKFIAVGIAPEYYAYGDKHGYEYINEALAHLETELPDYTFVPVFDIAPRWLKCDGELYYHPIHPVNKLPVAQRMEAAIAGEKFPRIESVTFEKGKAVCRIGGDCAVGQTGGFTLAGKNGKYYPARAEIKENTVVVACDDVPCPAYLTYAFMLYANDCNLRTSNGKPVLPYRTKREAVHRGYCFPPAFLSLRQSMTPENCFGWDIGTCREIPVWRDGEIYGGNNTEITVRDGVLTVTACPDNERYFLFGISPLLCASGHAHHLASYRYLSFMLSSPDTVDFLGVVARAADGDVYRFLLHGGRNAAVSLPVGEKETLYCIDVTRGYRCDGAAVLFPLKLRRSFVQAEFLFRSKTDATVTMKNLTFTDKNRTEPVAPRVAETSQRADTQLPDRK
ncbi:MAG: hypothetical protein HFE47_00540 [Clostridia bacterium]|nr:hypothetical protein [Clostridia bacterium]